MTPAGIEPATFRFVAQCLNHCATAFPNFSLLPITKSQLVHKKCEFKIHKPTPNSIKLWLRSMVDDSVIGRKACEIRKENITKNVWTVHENGLVWTLSHNEELCGLLEGPDMVKYSKFKWILLTYQKKWWMGNFMEEDLWDDHDWDGKTIGGTSGCWGA